MGNKARRGVKGKAEKLPRAGRPDPAWPKRHDYQPPVSIGAYDAEPSATSAGTRSRPTTEKAG